MERLRLSVNYTVFKKKPTSEETAMIYNKFETNKFTIDNIKKIILSGNTIRPAVIDEDNYFISQQVFFVDVDNNLTFRSIRENIILAKELNIIPSLIYMTFTSNYKNQKHRLVFVSEKVITDLKKRDEIQFALIKIFCGDTSTREYKKCFMAVK